MNCQKCHHPLWGVDARACPECGLPFTLDVSEIPPAVRVRCSACGACSMRSDVSASMDDGLSCPACGVSYHSEAFAILPPESDELSRLNPWFFDFRGHSTKRRWIKTLFRALTSPRRFASTLRFPMGSSPASRFALVTIAIFMALDMVLFLPLFGFLGLMEGGPVGGLLFIAGFALFFIWKWFAVVVGMSLTYWVMRRLGRANRTVRCGAMINSIWFGTSAFVFMPLPWIGDITSSIYWYILTNLLYRASNGSRIGVFMVATLIFPAAVIARRVWMFL